MMCTAMRSAQRVFIAVLLGAAPLYTVSAATESNVSLSAESLSPGKYVWHPEASAEGPVEMVVSIPLQIAYVYRGGTLIGMSTVSTGKPGYDTPTGSFSILQKHVDHKSNKYDDAPMPYMQRLTWD